MAPLDARYVATDDDHRPGLHLGHDAPHALAKITPSLPQARAISGQTPASRPGGIGGDRQTQAPTPAALQPAHQTGQILPLKLAGQNRPDAGRQPPFDAPHLGCPGKHHQMIGQAH